MRTALLAIVSVVALVSCASAVVKKDSKQGVASIRFLGTRPGMLGETGATWAYNWTSRTPPSTAAVDWVPMAWGANSIGPAVVRRLIADRRKGRTRYLLGFNEPDLATQANMTPQEAADLWPALEQTGLILGSPAPSRVGDGWLAQFMSLVSARHLRVNFIALHYYQDFTNPTAVPSLRRQLIAVHNRYHRPIWITELGAEDFLARGETMMRTPTESLAITYMRRTVRMLNALPFVQRYAWFSDSCVGQSAYCLGALFNQSGSLTAIGRAYRRF